MRVTLCCLALLMAFGSKQALACEPVSIFAAASTTDAVTGIAQAFEAKTGCKVTAVFAGSSILAKQIEAGAPASIFLSANESWMDELEKENLVMPGTRSDLLANELVLVVQKGQKLDFSFDEDTDLAAALAGERLAIANPDGVPAGIYAKQALTQMGLWDGVVTSIVAAEDVRAALVWVARGEARAGIVYRTDARISPDVEIAAAVPEETHDPVRYPVALVAGRANETARDFLAYLRGPAGARVFAEYGFTPLGTPVN
ncbi:molybdate ABC transporter substrate-binding protein [Parvibaculum sp.]|uniref:molybdate ABC transporter substrate-binding protein n=1 Tax=Parvibaculum sp. TaxID=2024848 RepID=UPI003BAC1407